MTYSSAQPYGGSAMIRRVVTVDDYKHLDPFLCLNDSKMSKPTWFKDHPHRGFGSVTYVIKGALRHEDSLGYDVVVKEGSMQWMRAGRGLMHSERPHGLEECWYTNLWTNAPANKKFCAPRYQVVTKLEVPKITENGIEVSILAGEYLDKVAAISTLTPINYFDIKLSPETKHVQQTPPDWNLFVHVIEGEPTISGEIAKPHWSVQFLKNGGDHILIENKTSKICRLLYFAGKPIGQPMVHKGLYVMSDEKQLLECVEDFNSFKNGFEHAKGWKSSDER